MHTDHAYQKSKDLFKSFMHPIQRPIETLDEITDEKPAEDQLKRDLLVNQ